MMQLTQKELFLEWVNDLEVQGYITTEKRNDLIIEVLRGDYDEKLSAPGGVFL